MIRYLLYVYYCKQQPSLASAQYFICESLYAVLYSFTKQWEGLQLNSGNKIVKTTWQELLKVFRGLADRA